MNAPLCPRMNGVCCTEPASPNPFMNSQWQRPLAKGCSGLERLRMAPEENLLRTLFRHKKAHFESKTVHVLAKLLFTHECHKSRLYDVEPVLPLIESSGSKPPLVGFPWWSSG